MRRWLYGLFIFSVVLRVATSGLELFWYDEAFTAFVVKLPFLQMLAAIRGDVHPPLFYSIEWLTANLIGRSEFALRLPGALFSSAAVVEMYLLVKRFAGENPARLAGFLMAVLPAEIYYGQEARMYSLLTLLVLLGARAVVDRNWLRLALSCALIPYTQNLGFIYVGILAGWGLWRSKGAAFKYLAIAGSSYLAWLPTLLQQAGNMTGGFWIPARDLSGTLYYLAYTTTFERAPEWLGLHLIILDLVVTAVAVIALLKSESLRQVLPLLALAFAPPLILFLASVLWHPVLLERALMPSGAMLAAAWAIGLLKLPGWSRNLMAVMTVPLLTASIVTYYADSAGQRSTQDPVVPLIEQRWQPGDALYHLNLSSTVTYDYYLPGKPGFSLPEGGDLGQSLTDPTKIAMGLKDHEKFPDQLRQLGYKRIWVMIMDSPVSSDFEMAYAARLLSTYPVIQRWTIFSTEYVSFTLALVRL